MPATHRFIAIKSIVVDPDAKDNYSSFLTVTDPKRNISIGFNLTTSNHAFTGLHILPCERYNINYVKSAHMKYTQTRAMAATKTMTLQDDNASLSDAADYLTAEWVYFIKPPPRSEIRKEAMSYMRTCFKR